MDSKAETRYSESIDERFAFLVNPRPEKPREAGITFIDAEGPFYSVLDDAHLRSLLRYAGEWIDWYKFTVGAHVCQPPELVAAKLRLLEEYTVTPFPGGNFLETAIAKGVGDETLDALRDVGFPRVEVSTTAIDVTIQEKAEIIERANGMGFDVHGEIGRKSSVGEETLSIEEVIDEMEVCLDAGADKVVLESDQVEETYSEDPEAVSKIDDEVGTENVVFELPLTPEMRVLDAAAWLINTFGPNVNIGNATPHYINKLEQMRRGIGPRIPP